MYIDYFESATNFFILLTYIFNLVDGVKFLTLRDGIDRTLNK